MEILKRVTTIISKKPLMFVLVTVIYFAILIFFKWQIKVTLNTLLFAIGGVIGIYLIDIVEAFINVNPSPFRSILFVLGFVIVSFFIVSSSGSYLASGLVLSMYLTIVIWLTGQFTVQNNLDSWFQNITVQKSFGNQITAYTIFVIVFFIETVLFIRQFPA